MNKRTIGILTFWNVPNYGTYAQAYALQKFMNKIGGNNAKQISHIDKHHYNYYYNKKQYYKEMPFSNYRRWKYLFTPETNVSKREKNFLDAYSRIPNISVNEINKNKNNKVFIGSDIVWDFSHEQFNHDKTLFGNGFDCEVNAYAASFGTIKSGKNIPEYAIQGIRKMNHISVRDANSADIVEHITGIRPDVVLDPVWLWDFTQDSNVIIPQEDNYILIYGQDFTEKFIENLIKYAKVNKKKLIALDCNEDKYDWCDKLVKQEDLDPLMWIGYFLKADAIATSTFHGLTFGLLFNKRIAFCKSDFILAKVKTLLEELDVMKIFENQDAVEYMLDYDWNYEDINKKINEKREHSISFIEKSLR